MAKKIKIAVLFSCSMFLLLRSLNCYAGIEQYVKYLNGPFVVNHSYLSNQDKAFQNPSYTWSTINNLSVQDAVTLRVVDSVLITTSFSVTVTVKIHYYTSPDTITTPATDVICWLIMFPGRELPTRE